jgi:hypothetical protein
MKFQINSFQFTNKITFVRQINYIYLGLRLNKAFYGFLDEMPLCVIMILWKDWTKYRWHIHRKNFYSQDIPVQERTYVFNKLKGFICADAFLECVVLLHSDCPIIQPQP